MSFTLKKTDKNKDIQKVYFIVIINIIIIIIITTIIIITIILSCLFFFWASKVKWTELFLALHSVSNLQGLFIAYKVS